jgi:hypothetical protein
MILYSKRLNALAEAAIVEALRLDAQEAPQKEVECKKDRRGKPPPSRKGPVNEQAKLPAWNADQLAAA